MALTSERFELGPRIGRGIAGDVHTARDKLTNDVVAVKLVDLEEAEDEVEDIQRIYSEDEDFTGADAVFDCIGDEGDERFGFEDLTTPGSFWQGDD